MKSSAERALGRRHLVFAIALAIIAGALYIHTMPPSVLDGDSGRWQYVCHVLGIPYVTGFPGLVLLGKLWTSVIPLGSIAYRMSLFSVVMGALGAGLAYLVFRASSGGHTASWLSALGFAVLPSTWLFAISVKAYSLNLVFVGALFVLLLLWSRTRREGTLRAVAVLYGLSLTNHNTMILFLPAFVVFVLWTDPRLLRQTRRLAALAVLAAAPLAVYLYIPLRGGQLWDAFGAEPGLPWPISVSRGWISSEYTPDWSGFWRLVLATADTRSLTQGWLDVPAQLITVYLPIVRREFPPVVLALALAGWVRLAIRRPQMAALFVLGWAAFPPIVVKYGHGMQSAFLIPANLMIMAGVASALAGVFDGIRALIPPVRLRMVLHAALALALLALIVRTASARYGLIDRSGDRAVGDYWTGVLQHPLEQGAGILAHSGVLTPLWYLQSIEGRRPDLRGLFPPDERIVDEWLRSGHVAYLAGPLDDWLPDAVDRYRLTPWGILTRIEPKDAPDASASALPVAGDRMRVGDLLEWLGSDAPPAVESGGRLSVRIHWRALRGVAAGYLVSLRLVAPDGQPVARTEDRLVSAWYPAAEVPAGRFILDMFELPVPQGTLPGRYALQAVVHEPDTGAALPPVRMRDVEIVRPSHPLPVDPGDLTRPFGHPVYGGEIALVGYAVDGVRLAPGGALGVEVLWQARHRPTDDYRVEIEWRDAGGEVRARTQFPAGGGLEPTSGWADGDLVRDRYRSIAPADLPPGEYSVRLALLNFEGIRLPAKFGFLSSGDAVELGRLAVIDRPRDFTAPRVERPVQANFGGKALLLGYDPPSSPARAGEELTLTLYWRGLQLMETRYTVFVHLLDGSGRIWAQRDSEPAAGDLPTTGWLPGEIVRDRVQLSLGRGVPSGEYTLRVGLYDSGTGVRLPVIDGDFVDVGLLSID